MATPSQQRWKAVREASERLRNEPPDSSASAPTIAVLKQLYDAGAEDMAATCMRIIFEYTPEAADEMRERPRPASPGDGLLDYGPAGRPVRGQL